MTKAEREKQHQRQVAVSRGKLVLIVVCLIAIPGTFWWNHREANDVKGRIAKVESPCLKYGRHSELCQKSFEEAIGTLTHAEACAVGRKSGQLKALRELARQLDVNFKEPCKGARLAQERQRSDERASTHRRDTASAPAAPEGGGANSSPSTGNSLPGRHEGGSGETDSPSHPHAPSVPHQSGGSGTTGGGESGPATPVPTAPSSPGASSSTPERTTETVVEAAPPAEAPAPVRGAVGAVVEGLKPTVEEAGATVDGTVEGVTGTSCELAKLLCPE